MQTESLDVRWGKLRVKSLAFDLPSNVSMTSVSVKAHGSDLGATVRQGGNRITIELREVLTLSAGERLSLVSQFASDDRPGATRASAPLPVPAADYVVGKSDSGDIVARSGAGTVIARGADAAMVIQAAIDRLPVTGGKVYVAAGRYDLTRTIKIEDKHGVHLEGAARGILFSGGNEGTSLRSDSAIDLIHIHGGKIKLAGVTISNLHLIGSGKDNGKAGILVTGNSDLLSLHQVGANNCGIGFHLKGGGPGAGVIDAPQIQFCDPQVNGIGLRIEHSHYAKVVGGEFSDCDRYGIMISSSDAGHRRSSGVKVNGVTAVRNGDGGILIGSNAECVTVTGGCEFAGSPRGSGVILTTDQGGRPPHNVIISSVHAYNNKHAGILVEEGEHVIVAQCICSGHDHVAVRHHGQQRGIHVGLNAEDVIIRDNLTHGNGERGLFLERTTDE